MRKNLIVVRAGRESLHQPWLMGSDRSYDVFVSYYGDSPGNCGGQAEYFEACEGLKYPALAGILEKRRDVLLRYETCWFPDDDLLVDCSTLNAMFELFQQEKLLLAQPALAAGSHLSHGITAVNPECKLRYTDFVEIMCPLMSRECLQLLGGSFGESISGWGLDFLWPHLLSYPQDKIAILDETPVLHTRPFQSGPFYRRCAELCVDPWGELHRIVGAHGVSWPKMVVHRAVPKSQIEA